MVADGDKIFLQVNWRCGDYRSGPSQIIRVLKCGGKQERESEGWQ